MSNTIESIYNFTINIPQYKPRDKQVTVRDCIDTKKAKEIRERIKSAEGITDDERAFLLAASTRHYKFKYDNIADYYAQATPEMQRLMEDSALVIIDVDDAVAKGYASLSKKIRNIITERVGE